MDPKARPIPDEEAARELARLQRLARVLDDWIRVPGTNLRIGLDGLVGLIPGAGDAATGALAAYLVIRAAHLGAPPGLLARMAGNVGLDLAAGAIPVLGDLFDVGFKANRRNVELLRRHLEGDVRRTRA